MFDLQQGVDFKLIIPENAESETAVFIQLLTGEYTGVTYAYGKVSAEEQVDDENASISFEFEIIDSNGIDNLDENVEFKNHIGNILVSLVLNSIPQGE